MNPVYFRFARIVKRARLLAGFASVPAVTTAAVTVIEPARRIASTTSMPAAEFPASWARRHARTRPPAHDAPPRAEMIDAGPLTPTRTEIADAPRALWFRTVILSFVRLPASARVEEARIRALGSAAGCHVTSWTSIWCEVTRVWPLPSAFIT
jgi:hypothetical protein